MSMPKIIPLYTAALALIFVALSWRTIRLRRKNKIVLGFGDSQELQRATRVHGNFAEYVPLALLLLTFLEMRLTASWFLHVFASWLLIARAAHAYGVSQLKENFRFRIFGMASTLTILGVCALVLAYQSVMSL
jgi:uncharacterized membrane protein YecN with MAPEG domain